MRVGLRDREVAVMTNEDYEQLQRLGRHLADLPNVGLLSPVRPRSIRRFWRRQPIGERLVFPRATPISRRDWDLDEPTERRYDLLVASNVFMYSQDPARWFENVLEACGYFLMIDPVRRRRNEGSELGPDGDRMRFAVNGARPRVDRCFDLALLGDRLLGYRTYYGGANPYDDDPLHVAALVRGDLATERHPPGIERALSELASEAPASGAG
jgi:hypothetical protein